ncbi:MAG: hypothetical protein LBK47_06915 [Prevotellaceae bacterium]|jgi:hypothetical protein|nr:hypothetical protein [Prevotellaceae bacterium]
MKKLVSFAAMLLVLAGMIACGKENEIEIYENHDISACTVDDPLVNIDWLKKFCTEHSKSKFTIEIHIYISRNKVNTILIMTKPFMDNFHAEQGVSVYPYNQFVLKNCLGDSVMSGETSVDSENFFPETPDWNQFFDDNEDAGLIWAINKE